MAEGSQGKRCPPSGFFPLTLSPSSATDRQEGFEDAVAMISALFPGLRYIEGDNRRAGWNPHMETLTVVAHATLEIRNDLWTSSLWFLTLDQIWSA